MLITLTYFYFQKSVFFQIFLTVPYAYWKLYIQGKCTCIHKPVAKKITISLYFSNLQHYKLRKPKFLHQLKKRAVFFLKPDGILFSNAQQTFLISNLVSQYVRRATLLFRNRISDMPGKFVMKFYQFFTN